MKQLIRQPAYTPPDIKNKIGMTQTQLSPAEISAKRMQNLRLFSLKGAGYLNVYQGYDKVASMLFAPGQAQDLINITVPSGADNVLCLTKYANYTSDIAAWGLFTWNMYINGTLVPEYSNVTDQLGLQYQMRDIGIDILIKAGQTFRVEAVASAVMPVVVPQYAAGISLLGVYGTFYRGVL